MRLSAGFLLLALGVAACKTPETPTPSADSTATAPIDTSAAAFTAYTCTPVVPVEASYPTDSTAVLRYNGQDIAMTVAESGSGARYVSDSLEWHTKGDTGLLSTRNADGTTGTQLADCASGSAAGTAAVADSAAGDSAATR